MKYILLNFAYGFGPFLRTTELAVAVNNLLAQKSGERFGVIVPWVYEEKQKRIMQEEFSKIIDKYPDEILLDKTLGNYLNSIFYGNKSYEDSLKCYLKSFKKLKKDISSYFSTGLIVENFAGKKINVVNDEIAFTITRDPRISFPIRPAYYASFAYISEILERAIGIKKIIIDRKLTEKVIPLYKQIEKEHDLHFIADPATFFYLNERPKRFKTEILTPPNAALPNRSVDCAQVKKGIYVTITGIPGLERLFEQARKIGLHIYTNKPESINGGEKALPNILQHPNILLHFARSGWGSIWLSQFTNTPFITPDCDKYDDPEIYFNTICIKKLGLGKIYRGQPLEELLDFKDKYKLSAEKIKKYLLNKYGTINGIHYTAEKIVNHYLNK